MNSRVCRTLEHNDSFGRELGGNIASMNNITPLLADDSRDYCMRQVCRVFYVNAVTSVRPVFLILRRNRVCF
jgi:hypothetical protein